MNALIHALDSSIGRIGEFVGSLNDHLITIAGSDFSVMDLVAGGTIHPLSSLIML